MTIVYGRENEPDLSLAAVPGDTLHAMATELLVRLQGCAAQLGVRLPERQFTFMSPVPVDCAQVAVVASGYQPMPLWVDLIVCSEFRWCGQFHIVISRKTCAMPTANGSQAPSAANMSEALKLASDDAEVLLLLVQTVREIGPQMTLETPAPEGGYQSVILHILIPVTGGLM